MVDKVDDLQQVLTRERARADRLSAQLTEVSEESSRLRRELAVVKTPVEGVWRWQGDGNDSVDGLTCPVLFVVGPDRLRELFRLAEELMRAAQRVACLEDHGDAYDRAVALASISRATRRVLEALGVEWDVEHGYVFPWTDKKNGPFPMTGFCPGPSKDPGVKP